MIDGRLHTLARGKANKAEARRRFLELLAERDRAAHERADPPVGLAIARYLAELRRRVERGELSPSSRDDAIRRIGDFPERFGDLPVSALSARNVREWLETKPSWSGTTRHDAVGALKAALNWAATEGLIAANPIRDMPKPDRAVRRERVVDPDRVPELLGLIRSEEFHDLATFLWLTGCRPKEARLLEAHWIDWDRRIAVLPASGHKTGRKTGRARVIHLPEAAVAIARRRATASPDGPIFRNARGRPWTKDAINCQVRRLRGRSRGRFGSEVVAYALRHVFATETLQRTGDLAGVAALLGHAGTDLLGRVYSHLDKRQEHLG